MLATQPTVLASLLPHTRCVCVCAAVGRVFTSGEPEMSHNVQRYDQHVYLRAAEAQVRLETLWTA